jgi:hypothetical protein
MRNILEIASMLDNSGQYSLSDKLFRIAQSTPAQFADANRPYARYPTNPADMKALKNQIVRTDFRGDVYQAQRGDTRYNTSDIRSFAAGLMNHAISKRFPNMKDAFDDYANKGAIFKGQKVQNVPQLVELYERISNYSGDITSAMLEDELRNIFTNPQNPNTPNTNQENPVPYNANVPNNNLGTFNEQSNSNTNKVPSYAAINSTDPKSFVNNLLTFMESRGADKNLTKAFNDYADAGATYNGVSIKNNPALFKVYKQIASSNNFIGQIQLESAVTIALNQLKVKEYIKTMTDNLNADKNMTQQEKEKLLAEITQAVNEMPEYNL